MVLFILIVVLSTISCRSIFRPPIRPNFKIKPGKLIKFGKKVVEHAPTVLEVADIAVGLATAKVKDDDWVVWKDLKKIMIPDMKTLTDKIVSYGTKFEDLYSMLHTLDSSIHSEALIRANLTNVVDNVQKNIKRATSAGQKTWTVMKKLRGMSLKNEVLGGIGASGSSILLCCALVISYRKYKAKEELRKTKKFNKMVTAVAKNYMSDHQLHNDRFQDVTQEFQAQGQPLQGLEGSAQENEPRSWIARIF